MKRALASFILGSLFLTGPVPAQQYNWRSWKKAVKRTPELKSIYKQFQGGRKNHRLMRFGKWASASGFVSVMPLADMGLLGSDTVGGELLNFLMMLSLGQIFLSSRTDLQDAERDALRETLATASETRDDLPLDVSSLVSSHERLLDH